MYVCVCFDPLLLIIIVVVVVVVKYFVRLL